MFNFFKKVFNNFKTKLSTKRLSENRPYIFAALGDSTIHGLGASSVERSLANIVYEAIKYKKPLVEFYNFGRNGHRTRNVLDWQLAQAVEKKPDLILISIGANDVMRWTTLNRFRDEYRAVLKELTEKTHSKIIISNIPDITSAPVMHPAAAPYFFIQVKRFNSVISDLSQEFNCILVDTYSESKLFKGRRELVADDGLHPSDLGYALWANNVISKTFPKIFS